MFILVRVMAQNTFRNRVFTMVDMAVSTGNIVFVTAALGLNQLHNFFVAAGAKERINFFCIGDGRRFMRGMTGTAIGICHVRRVWFMAGAAFQKFSMFLMTTAAFKLGMGADIFLQFFSLRRMTRQTYNIGSLKLRSCNG